MNIDRIIKEAILEDLGDGDHSSLSTIPDSATGKVQLLIKEKGILAGIEIAQKVFKEVDSTLIFNGLLEDGDPIESGDIGFTVEGKSISLLSAERLSLNFLQRMSGIASYTHYLVRMISGTKAKILDTRKTTPNFRIFEKEAVRIGGGVNHRMGLYDMIMIKDNHIDFAGGIKQAILATDEYLKNKKKKLKIEIEVRNFKELDEVLQTGKVDRIMLDNFLPDDLKKAIIIIDEKYETEASGGINETNIRQFAETGVDFISIGALTHQIRSLDMSLKAINK